MTASSRSSIRARLYSNRSFVLLVAVALAAFVGVGACDSGGSNSNENEDDDGNGDPDIAQTFDVTVASLDGDYPYSDQNVIGVAFAIDGEVGATITLERGKTYAFDLGNGVDPNHPFYVGTTAEGGGSGAYRDNPALKTTGTVTFTVPSDAPNSLFYVCDNHVYMGGEMTITDPSGSGGDDSGDDSSDDPPGDDGY
jgi:hypothetical protein